MDFCEYAAKPLLAAAGIEVPAGITTGCAAEAMEFTEKSGSCVVKAQVAAGKRGKAGGIQPVADPLEAKSAAQRILGMRIAGHPVEKVLVEEQVARERECYAAIVADGVSQGPLLLFSPLGGMDVEDIAARDPQAMRRIAIDIRTGPDEDALRRTLDGCGLGSATAAVADSLIRLYRVYRDCDAELIEINPLAITKSGAAVALDCKLSVDDASVSRQTELAAAAVPARRTALEARAAEQGLKYIELEGNVGVLANGAGLTMTSMDAIVRAGGHPANFLEIGGESYTKARPALEIVLANPGVKSLLVNFCGAFARTDVMADGVAQAWLDLRPEIRVFFAINGTGAEEAVQLIRDRIGIDPFRDMDAAVAAAVNAATAQETADS